MNDEKYQHMLVSIPEGEYIAGIFNYCDRRCEFCRLRQHCSQYAIERELTNKEELPVKGQSWLGDGLALFEDFVLYIKEWMDLLDISAYDLSRGFEFSVMKDEKLMFSVESRRLMQMAEYYARETYDWFCSGEAAELQKEIKDKDVIDSIEWYMVSIAAKIFRALAQDIDILEEDEIQNDQNGSARIALFMIERSLFAWAYLDYYVEGHVELFRKSGIMLLGIQEALLQVFPYACHFQRPGFEQQRKDWDLI